MASLGLSSGCSSLCPSCDNLCHAVECIANSCSVGSTARFTTVREMLAGKWGLYGTFVAFLEMLTIPINLGWTAEQFCGIMLIQRLPLGAHDVASICVSMQAVNEVLRDPLYQVNHCMIFLRRTAG